MGALLAADIQDAPLRHVEDGLQGERALANAGLATQQHDAARHQSATQHTVQLVVVHVDARLVVNGYVAQLHGLGLAATSARRVVITLGAGYGRRCGRCYAYLLECVPLSAARTFAYPFCRFLSAVAANICCSVFCHNYFSQIVPSWPLAKLNHTKVRIIFFVSKFIAIFAL